MEEPELVYCAVIDSEKDIQPPPPPLPKRRKSISASFIDVQNLQLPRRFSPLQSMAIMTNNSYQLRNRHSASKKQVLLSIAVAIFAILLTVFMTLYFTTEAKCRCCDCPRNSLPNTSHNDVCQNYSIMSNSSNNTVLDCKMLKKDLEVKKLAYASFCIECSEYSVLFHRENTDDYIISKSAPQMTAITACFWVNTLQKTQNVVHYITYAVSKDEFGERDNEFGIGRQSTTIEFYVKYNKSTGYLYSRAENIVINDGKWHAICGLWSSKHGEVKIFNDGNLVHEEYGFKTSQTISGEGTWVLGQDSEGGKFAVNQTMQGEITEVNIWDRVLSDEEINSFSTSCQSRLSGNVKSWDDFTSGVKGKAAFVQRPTCCNASTTL